MSSTPPASTPPAPPPAADLPYARQLARVPAGIGTEALARLRQFAYLLPQVLTPADLAVDGETPATEDLDRQGLVCLQKAAPGGRPARWIAPAAMPAALAHLDHVGTKPEARPLMLARLATLEGLGVARDGAGWSREVSHTLALSEPGWQVPVLFRVPAAPEAVDRFFRDGDHAALQAALGAAPPYPHAAALQAHLEQLLERSRWHAQRHLGSLLPRWQAECATPRESADVERLKQACTRVQDRWEHRVSELTTLEGLNDELAFEGYPDSFPAARGLARKVVLYVGPPNSGKTHAAFERLAQALDGSYLAPLRLLALEGRDRLVARGVPCSLLTGEENVPAAGARVVSSTIEMVNTRDEIDVAVVDEAQMVFDPSRGWAWTQAIVAVPARELIIICSAYAVPAIENLLGLCGERAEVREFERKQHVDLLPAPLPLAALQHGDAVVAFSRRDVLQLRDRIAAQGRSVSVVYGALPPEVRRREAERFAQGESQILVATDAIGMGLNLPIRRVLFSTLQKFDGTGDRTLSESEVHQIAGRAGRFGLHEEGFTGVLADAEPTALRTLRQLLARTPRAPRDFKAPVAPNHWHVQTIASRLQLTRLREVLDVFVGQLRLDDAHFQVAELDAMLELAADLDRCAGRLPLRDRFVYAQAPVDTRTEAQRQEFLDWVSGHATTGRAGRPWFLDAVDGHSRLERMEQALRSCSLWLWLDLRFPGVYGLVDEVVEQRNVLNDGIERQLKGKRPLARLKPGGGRRF